MANIFIIGNGFDLAHGLRTSYSDFREYLLIQQQKKPETSPAELLVRIITNAIIDGDNWSDFENALGRIDYKRFFEDPRLNRYYHNYSPRDYERRSPLRAITELRKYFKDWINSVNLADVSAFESFSSLFDPQNDFAFTFNYTLTLEQLYNAKHVCHVHGKVGKGIIFGHGNQTALEYNNSFAQRLHNSLRKDINTGVEVAQKFYFRTEMKKGTHNIFSMGFSYADIDMRIIHFIASLGSKKWFLHDYDFENLTKYCEIIKNSAFGGKIETIKMIHD